MAESALAPLLEIPPAESRAYLVELARQEGAAALETLRLALEVPALAAAAVEALAEVPAQESWELLEQAAGQGVALRKAARRAQHRLRSRGFIPIPKVAERASPAVEQARASFFDPAGYQFLRVVRPAQLGMARYAGFILSPTGLDTCLYALAGRADVEGLLAEEDLRFGEDLLEMGLGYVARRVRQAAARSREQGQPLHEDYLEAAALIEDAPEDTSLAGIEAGTATVAEEEARQLLLHPSMRSWALAGDDLEPYLRDWQHLLEFQPLRTEEGLPNLGALQARGQVTARVIGDLLDELTCRRLAQQLREQAAMLWRMGEAELAGRALRCATGLEQHPATEDPFLRALVGVSMERALQQAQQEASQGPWMPLQGEGGPLWVPRPEEPAEEDEGEAPAGLWLPGRR